MRTSYAEPLRPVRLDASTPDQQSVALRGPSETPALPGRLEDVETTAEDGTRVRSWLCLPEGASADSPAPLLLWIHGGPLGSWNAWSWRWNPWIAVAQGYAVLLPDPASVHRLRAGLHRPRLGCLGRGAVHRPDVGHRRGRRA